MEKTIYLLFFSILIVTGLSIPLLFIDANEAWGPFWGEVAVTFWTFIVVSISAWILARLLGYGLGRRKQ